MKPIIIDISEKEYNDSKLPILFSGEHLNRRFIKIKCAYEYLIAWQSDLVEPSFVEIKENIYAIGVDQNFAILDFSTNTIEIRLKLPYNFLEFVILKGRLLLITELELIELDSISYQIINEYAAPDIISDVKLNNNQITITCLNEEIIILE